MRSNLATPCALYALKREWRHASIHRKGAGVRVLVTDLVDGLILAPAGIEPVRRIEDEAGLTADVAVSVYDTGRDPDSSRIRSAYVEHHAMPACRALRARVPGVQV